MSMEFVCIHRHTLPPVSWAEDISEGISAVQLSHAAHASLPGPHQADATAVGIYLTLAGIAAAALPGIGGFVRTPGTGGLPHA